MANYDKPYYNGNPIFTPGKTPFGFYDNDTNFQIDVIKVTKYCASRLGYPVMDVELLDSNFFTAFESAITTYGNEVYAYKLRDNQFDLEGTDLDIFEDSLGNPTYLNGKNITPNLSSIINISKQYGNETGTGGNIDWRSGNIDLVKFQQDYDLNQYVLNTYGEPKKIEIKRVFYKQPPALTRLYDPYVGLGAGYHGLLDSLGGGVAIPSISFMMRPLSLDMQTLGMIEMNDLVRRDSFSFEIQNNKLRIFPIPRRDDCKLYFEYILEEDRQLQAISKSNVISDISNSPFNNPIYSKINSIGKQWIFEFALALCKEMLGYVRGKYSNIPIPEDQVQLNQSDLISSATETQKNLLENLRLQLDETSRVKQLERKSKESEYRNQEINNIPMTIYVG